VEEHGEEEKDPGINAKQIGTEVGMKGQTASRVVG